MLGLYAFVNNREVVGHRPGGHDDCADSVAGVTWEVTKNTSNLASHLICAHTPRINQTGMPIEAMNVGAREAFNIALERAAAKILRKNERLASREQRREARRERKA